MPQLQLATTSRVPFFQIGYHISETAEMSGDNNMQKNIFEENGRFAVIDVASCLYEKAMLEDHWVHVLGTMKRLGNGGLNKVEPMDGVHNSDKNPCFRCHGEYFHNLSIFVL